MYKSNFNRRYTTAFAQHFTVDQFSGLIRERYVFDSDKGQKLVGYLYENNSSTEYRGVIVFAHGLGGGGQTGYMDLFDYMTQNGYYVFAYDATANDESEGEVVGGLPQGIIDLDYAISFVKTIHKLDKQPVSLMGYSWGGLSVVNAINYHPDVRCVISLAGFNKSANLIFDRAKEIVGRGAKILTSFVSLHEFFTYEKYALASGMSGFKNSDCAVMIVHSEDDTVVPIEYGYDTYYSQYKDDPRFVFKRLFGRGHDVFKTQNGELDKLLLKEIIMFLDKQSK